MTTKDLPAYRVVPMGRFWWVLGGEEPAGPYDTRREAEGRRAAFLRLWRHEGERGYVSVDSSIRRT